MTESEGGEATVRPRPGRGTAEAGQSETAEGMGWLEALSDLAVNWTEFAATRIRADVETQHALLHCRSARDFGHIQGQHLQTALDQYAAEAGRTAEWASSVWGAAAFSGDGSA